jgi:hypothetical protein
MSATGSDSVSTAINQTLPIIESPVVEGLPDAQAALTNTGSKIVSAADMYAETDQLLGEHLGTVQFLAARDQQAAGALAEAAEKKNDATADEKPATTPSAGVATNLTQASAMTQAAQPVTRGLQSVMSSAQQATGGMGNAGAPPAKLADDAKDDDTTKPDESQTGDAQLVDAATADSDGAAAGGQGSGSVPAPPPTAGRPETTPSGHQL